MAEAKKQHYTEEGYRALVEEFEYLKNVRRREVKDALALARSYGDLSENSEYDEAKDEQAKVEGRINELDSLIKNAVVVHDAEVDESIISVGAHIKVYDETFDEELEYNIVGSNEANAFIGNISDQSPIGSALIGKRVDDEVEIHVPNGSVLKLRVLEVGRTNKS